MNTNVRQILFAISPAVRRIFYFDAFIYGLVSIASMFLLITRKISVKNLLLGLFFLISCLTFSAYVDLTRYIKYFPVIFFIVVYGSTIRTGATIKFKYFVALFFLVSSYSLYQNYFGLFSWDISFIQSGIGNIGEDGYLLGHNDFRPFSLFSGIPEATFFYILALAIFFKKGHYLLCLMAIFLALITGSRGVIISFILGMSVVYLFRKKSMSKRGLICLSFIAGCFVYFVIFSASAYLSFLQGEFQENRLFFWGSMGARIFYLFEFFSSFSPFNIFTPLFLETEIYDNIFLTLINDFGLVIAFILLYLIYGRFYSRDYWSRVILATLIVYGFFADNILSIYLLSIFAFGTTILRQLSTDRI